MSYDKSKLADYLTTIFENTSTDTAGISINDARWLLGAGAALEMSSGDHTLRAEVPADQGKTLAIRGDGLDAFIAFIDECMADEFFERSVGRRAVENALNELLRATEGTLPDDVVDTVKTKAFTIVL